MLKSQEARKQKISCTLLRVLHTPARSIATDPFPILNTKKLGFAYFLMTNFPSLYYSRVTTDWHLAC